MAGGNFYPDFVAKLKDGRVLVVEYKGQQHAEEQETKDTRENRIIGEQWQMVSDGKGTFVLATMKKGDVSALKQQIRTAVSTRTLNSNLDSNGG